MVAIGGPTATGKTALSVALAKEFGGEVVNADSMQIYQGLDVGTAKPTAEERQGVPHHLMDFLPPETPYSVANFTAAAAPLIEQLNSAGKLPIVTGGTGLYITSLMKGTAFAPEKPTPPSVRGCKPRRTSREAPPCMRVCSKLTLSTPKNCTPTTYPVLSVRWNCMRPPAAA